MTVLKLIAAVAVVSYTIVFAALAANAEPLTTAPVVSEDAGRIQS